MTENKNKSIMSDDFYYRRAVDQIGCYNSSLTKFVPSSIFLTLKNKVFSPVDIAGWTKRRLWFYQLASPFYIPNIVSPYWVLLTFFWSIIVVLWYAFFEAGRQLLNPETRPSIPSEPATLVDVVFLGGLFIISFFYLALLCWKIIQFLRDNRYSIFLKMFWTIGYSTFLGWGVINLIRQADPNKLAAFLTSPLGYILIFLSWVPFWGFIYANFLELAFGLIKIIIEFIDHLFQMHQAKQQKAVCHIALAQIPYSEISHGDCWTMSQLSKEQIETLHSWAEANRDGSEKRVTPTLVGTAIIGILISTQPIGSVVDNIFSKVSDAFTGLTFQNPELFAIYVLSIFAIMIFARFLVLLINLFENLIVQGIIMEVCTVAFFAKNEYERETGLIKSQPKSPLVRLLRFLIGNFL